MLDRARTILKDYFGYEDFRPHQSTLVEHVLNGRDVLGVMPTGAGKSLVYQIPALVNEGLTLVISPLISLMKDQVDALTQAGVKAAFLNSSLSSFEMDDVLAAVRYGHFPLLYVAPERLIDARFMKLCQEIDISLVAVDEAHCISQWGKDFRPSYTKIAGFIDALPKRPCVCALTATATDTVREDIVRTLSLRDPFVCVAGFDRKNLYFGIERPKPANKETCLLRLLATRTNRSGIIYCSTRDKVEDVCQLLNHKGHAATCYHAGLPDATRQQNQESFLHDHHTIMVATNAFGMGIDKSNVSFVIHYNMPRDLESYYQEAGRAGRDGSKADCILIYNKGDVSTVNFFAECGLEERLEQGMDRDLAENLYKLDLDRIRNMTYYCTTTDCLRSFFLRYFGERNTPYRCENCSSCEAETETHDETINAQKIISCVMRLKQRNRELGKTMIIDILRGSQSQKILDSGFDTLSTYGIMKDVSKDIAYALLDALIAEEYLRLSESKYPVVISTAKATKFIVNKEQFFLTIAKKKAAEAAVKERKDAKAKDRHGNTLDSSKPATDITELDTETSSYGVDPDLFEKLRQLRYSLAQEQDVAAFIIFSDKTLRDMCQKLPQTPEAFLEVSGVGNKKAEQYGEDFIACIKAYQGNHV